MINWIKHHYQADVIHLSNALLSGLAPKFKQELGIPVCCSLQDEDVWIDVMKPQFREEAWDLIRENGRYIDGFVGVSRYFSHMMRSRLDIPDSKLYTVHLGVDPSDYEPLPVAGKPGNIGFISRMCEDNGLEILVDAFIKLRTDQEFRKVNLILTGGATNEDKDFLKKIRRKLRNAGLTESVVILDDFEDEGRKKFFRMVSIVSVPVLQGEAFGLYQLESMASGVPVAQPALGAFPEIVGESGGGVIYGANRPEMLAEAIAVLLRDPGRLIRLSEAGIRGVQDHFNIFTHAEELVSVYKNLMIKE
jgi:glycosyltransferase involved in cell wall biosynthesis